MKYHYNMTPVEVMKYVRTLNLSFDDPAMIKDAFEKVYEYGFDIGYDDAMDVKQDEIKEGRIDRPGLGE